MKPLKNGLNFSNWLMRICLMVLIAATFWKNTSTFDFSSKEFYISFSFIIFGILLFIGGFMSKPAITVIMGLLICLLSVYEIFLQFSGNISSIVTTYLIMASVSLYFACAGNNS